MQGLLDLFKSERGILGILLVSAATVMVFTGHLAVEAWESYTWKIAGFVIAGKTATTVAGLIANRPVSPTVVASPAASSSTVVVETTPGGGS